MAERESKSEVLWYAAIHVPVCPPLTQIPGVNLFRMQEFLMNVVFDPLKNKIYF